jgi:hypothetical protein
MPFNRHMRADLCMHRHHNADTRRLQAKARGLATFLHILTNRYKCYPDDCSQMRVSVESLKGKGTVIVELRAVFPCARAIAEHADDITEIMPNVNTDLTTPG